MELEQEYIEFLNELRESGDINMMSAAPNLALAFGLEKREATLLLLEWMKIV